MITKKDTHTHTHTQNLPRVVNLVWESELDIHWSGCVCMQPHTLATNFKYGIDASLSEIPIQYLPEETHTHTHTHTNDRETGIDPQNWFSEVYLKVPTLESPDVARSALIQYEAHLLSVHPILRAELVAALKATIRVSSEVTQKGKNSGIKGCPTHRLYRAFHVDNEPLSFFSIDYIRDVMRRHPSTELLSTLTHTHTHTHTLTKIMTHHSGVCVWK
eukprot:GHVR01061667.1.p1 GENE.GHVR01061667.1~~GHVR01061667.1.p1  ORF type:complete len:217 (+),score=105.95 GHVR01061667.1:106-756(+)